MSNNTYVNFEDFNFNPKSKELTADASDLPFDNRWFSRVLPMRKDGKQLFFKFSGRVLQGTGADEITTEWHFRPNKECGIEKVVIYND